MVQALRMSENAFVDVIYNQDVFVDTSNSTSIVIGFRNGLRGQYIYNFVGILRDAISGV